MTSANPFTNRWAALGLVVVILLLVAELVGTDDRDGVLAQVAGSAGPDTGQLVAGEPTVIEAPAEVAPPAEDLPQVIEEDDLVDGDDPVEGAEGDLAPSEELTVEEGVVEGTGDE